MAEDGINVEELVLRWRTLGALDGSGYEGNRMKVIWTYRLKCDRSMGGEGRRRRRDVVCRWTIDQKS